MKLEYWPYTVKDQSAADPNLLKSQIPYSMRRGGGGGGGVDDDQLPTFNAEYKSAKIPKSLYDYIRRGGGGGGGGAWWPTSNFWCWVQIC